MQSRQLNRSAGTWKGTQADCHIPRSCSICDRLELDLVGVCSTSVSTIPERYEDLPEIGTAMSPDMEVIASLNPDWILSPSSLQSDLQPKYEAIHTDWAF